MKGHAAASSGRGDAGSIADGDGPQARQSRELGERLSNLSSETRALTNPNPDLRAHQHVDAAASANPLDARGAIRGLTGEVGMPPVSPWACVVTSVAVSHSIAQGAGCWP